MGANDPLADSALLIIDVINDYAFPGGDELVRQMDPVVEAIDALRHRADALQRPVIHVNDNFGRWRSNFAQVIEWCRRKGGRGADIATRLSPRESDYFVLKPGQSGFYQTPLPALLGYLEVSGLVLTGVAGDQCVLNTAMAAHMRDYRLWVPADATASITPKRNHRALDHISEVLGASVAPANNT
ncbi:MAG TPA: isochorismatase family cysteine hydrolase [Rhodanobacteraceae bacterium]|nr:isochorismatase family cysteine hydrolase [Rhodanobacteraceae bacterium]